MLTALMKIKTEMSCGLLSELADFKAAADLDYKHGFRVDTYLRQRRMNNNPCPLCDYVRFYSE